MLNILENSTTIKDTLTAEGYDVKQTFCRNDIEELFQSFKSESNISLNINFESNRIENRNEANNGYSVNTYQVYVISKSISKMDIPTDFFTKLDDVYNILENEFDIRIDDINIDNYNGEYYFSIISIEIIN